MVVIFVGPLLIFISARFWERKFACGRHNGWQMVAQRRYCQTNHRPFAGRACLSNNEQWANCSSFDKLVRFHVGINIGPLSAFISARFWEHKFGVRSQQRLANGWPNNVIVELSVGPLDGTPPLYLTSSCMNNMAASIVAIIEYNLKINIMMIKLCLPPGGQSY